MLVASARTSLNTKLLGGTVNKWFKVGLTAIGSKLTVTVNGETVLTAEDTVAPLLSGRTIWEACCTGQDAVADYASITATTVPVAGLGGSVLQAVTNAASFLPGPVAPGEIVVLFGANLGPAALAGLQLDSSGKISVTDGGTSATFDGVAAPLIYSSANQVAAIVPFEVSASTNLQVQFH